MPIHDWMRVSAETWHDFHLAWIAELRNRLNGGVLLGDYYAMAEQLIGTMGPDVLTLQSPSCSDDGGTHESNTGGLAVATAPPKPKLMGEAAGLEHYLHKQRHLVIRHSSGDRIVALIELLSPGNKSSRSAWESFVDKAVTALQEGYHLLLVDLFPPTLRDPNGVHAAIWEQYCAQSFQLPPATPLTLAAYATGPTTRAYVETTAVGCELLEMPLFLESEIYVNVPLEATYCAAFRGVPNRWKVPLEQSLAQ